MKKTRKLRGLAKGGVGRQAMADTIGAYLASTPTDTVMKKLSELIPYTGEAVEAVARALGERFLAPPAIALAVTTRIVVDGEPIWERSKEDELGWGGALVSQPRESPLRFVWSEDGCVEIVNESQRRLAVQLLQDPAPSTWQSLTPAIAAAATGGMMYRYGAAIASQIATKAKK